MTLLVRHPDKLISRWGYTRANRFKAGLCTNCGGEVEGDVRRRASGTKKRMCRACLKKNCDRSKKERERREAACLCVRCGKKAPKTGVKQCVDCTSYISKSVRDQLKKKFFDRKARNASGIAYSILAAKMLWSLWKEQRGRCALTGVRLTRENCEIDHIIPKSKGGTNDRLNLRWLLSDVNQAKRALTDEEFINMCQSVVDYNTKATE